MSCEQPDLEMDLSAVALFPLPNVVLFPTAILPLHIFEERYKAMTRDILAGSRLLAMALLRPGWEMNYYGRPAIEPVVCVGRIISDERLPDGKYNFLLQGIQRARIIAEHDSSPYRTARLEPLAETPVMEIDVACERQRLAEIFQGGLLAETSVGRQFRDILSSPLTTPQIADLAAFNLLENVHLKQALLAECDVVRRINRIIDALRDLAPILEASMRNRRGQSLN